MPLALGLVVVFEVGARVQSDVVVQQLQIARIEHHREVHRRIGRERVHQCNRLVLRVGEPRHFRIALRRADMRADVAAGELALVHREDRLLVGRCGVVGVLALQAPGERLVEHFEQVGPGARDLVVDRHRARDHRAPAASGGAQHEQAHYVARVGVVLELGIGLVAAALGPAQIDLHVAHIAQHVALGTLRDGGAEVFAQPPIDQPQVGGAVALRGKAAHHEQPRPVLQLRLCPLDQPRKSLEHERLA